MKQSIIHIALVVRDYDEAIDFYTKKLHFDLIEDTYQPEQDKRWVVVAPPGPGGTTLLLAKASKPEQLPFVGDQAGGRVFLFLNSDDFWRDYREMVSSGIEFVREPKRQTYGTVAVFKDLYGNLWDLLQMNPDHPILQRMNGLPVESGIKKGLTLCLLDGTYCVSRLAPDDPLPGWIQGHSFASVTRTEEELSIVARQESIPAEVRCERDWRMLKVEGTLDFSLTGILAGISTVLAQAEISLFAVSTFDTDYLLVKADRLHMAIDSLRAAGYTLLD